MNNSSTTNVAAWVEHEEIIVVSLLKKALRCIECETGTIITLGLIGVCITGIIVRLSQLSPYFQLSYGCD
jgi:hypothetical protein